MAKHRLRSDPVTVEAPASSANLGPGFDALALALELHLRVTVTPLDAGAEQLLVEGEGADEIGLDAGNRFLIGLEHGLQEFGLEPPVMRIEMDNQIPLARGLGSSAAATVAGLLVAEAMAGESLGTDRIHAIASQIDGHPDNVAAALFGGLVVVARGRDGTPRTARFDAPAGLHAALFIPDQAMRTDAMRAALPDDVPHADAAHNVGVASFVVAALVANRLELLDAMSEDRLHEPYRVAHFPQLPALVAAARAAGARGAALSGAGSAVLALCDAAGVAQRVAAAMAATAAQGDVAGRATVVRPSSSGARVVTRRRRAGTA
jgi:homoserine kinase